MILNYKARSSPYFIASLVVHALLLFGFYNANIQNISLSQSKKSLNKPVTLTTELSLQKQEEIKKEVKKVKKKVVEKKSLISKPLETAKQEKVEETVSKPESSTYVADFSRSQDQTPEELRAFFTSLIEEIHKKKKYPTLSKRLRESGVVHVKFIVDADGVVHNPTLKKPCTYKRLNKSALKVVSNLELSELPPKSYGKIEITFPMDYIL